MYVLILCMYAVSALQHFRVLHTDTHIDRQTHTHIRTYTIDIHKHVIKTHHKF